MAEEVMARYPIAPMAKPRPRVTRNVTYMPGKYMKWKADIAKLRIELPDAFSVRFFFAMPKSWSKSAKTAYRYEPHQQRPDLDNVLGGLMDACLKNDSSVYEVQASKWWDTESGIEIEAL
jgi:Holliday junction resolvase RusA-like endonuclease